MILKIKDLRKERGLTQKDLADMAGISVSYLSELESGKKAANTHRIAKIADALDVRPVDLFSSENLPNDLKNHIISLNLLTEAQRRQVFEHAEALAFQKSAIEPSSETDSAAQNSSSTEEK